MSTEKKPKEETFAPDEATPPIQINIPPKVDLSAFASEMDDADEVGSVQQMQGPLDIRKFQEVKDYIWVNPDPAYTSANPYFLVSVPSDEKKGRPTLHLIQKDLAVKYLKPGQWLRMKFALAALPDGNLFLGIVPCRNLDNDFNRTMLAAIEKAKTGWHLILRLQGRDGYYAQPAEDPDFVEPPIWPSTPLEELVHAHFSPHKVITTADHAGMLRIRGIRQRID